MPKSIIKPIKDEKCIIRLDRMKILETLKTIFFNTVINLLLYNNNHKSPKL